MEWNRKTLSHTTTLAIHRIVRLPGVTRENFVRTLTEEVLPMAALPGLNRATNVVAQELLVDEAADEVDTCLWSIHFNGTHSPRTVREKSQETYESVREQVEAVGIRTSFRMVTLVGRWEAES